MPYEFVDNAFTADVGFVARGATLDACFAAAAAATLEVMLANAEALLAREQHPVAVEDAALDLALLKFLEELVYYKDAEHLLLRCRDISVRRAGALWRVTATLEGEPIDPARHELSADVKAVTLHRLAVRQTDHGWEATVVLDI